MGIFDSEKQVSAASVVTKVLPDYDDPLPGIIAGSSITNLNISDELMKYMTEGYAKRAEDYYKYGRDHYSRGLPQTTRVNENINYNEIRRILETQEGSKVQITYARVNTEYASHYAAQYEQDVRNINTVTLRVGNNPPGATSGSTVYHVAITVASNYSTVTLHYSYSSMGSIVTGMNETIPLPYNTDLVYQVQYQKMIDEDTPSGIPIYWTYVKGTGTYPVLDTIPNGALNNTSDVYPIIPFYEDKTQIGNPANAGTPLYETSKKLIKKLGFKYEDVVTSLAEGTGESIGKGKGLYAYMYLGIEPTAGILPNYETATSEEKEEHLKNSQAALTYLINFFLQESPSAKSTKVQFDKWRTNIAKIKLPELTEIGITDGTFKTRIIYKYIDVSRHTGVIGEPGWCTNEVYISSIWDKNAGFFEGLEFAIDTSTLTYRRQESPTTYVQVVVCGLLQITNVFDGTGTAAVPRDAFKGEDSFLMVIPLYRSLVKQISSSLRNRLIHASMCFVFNSYQIQEIKWYQQNFWSFVYMAVAIVLSVPSGGASIGWAQIGIQAGLKAAAYALLVMYIKYLIFNELTKFVVDEFGAETAYVVAIVAMAYGKGAKSGAVPGMPWAIDLVSVGSSIWTATGKAIEDKTIELQEEFTELQAQIDIAQKELDKSKELLNTDTSVDPWLFVNPLPDLMFSQSVDSFINQRIHIGNPGTLTLGSPGNYVGLMLTLPTIDDTLTK